MSKYCPECRQANEDSRIFCSCCGAALDANVRLVQDLEKASKIKPTETPAPQKKADDDDFEDIPRTSKPDKKMNVIPWIVLGVLVIAAAVGFFLLR